jgi:hypothetical protein
MKGSSGIRVAMVNTIALRKMSEADHRLQVQFLAHRGKPPLPVGCDGVDHLIQQVPGEALGGIDVAELLPLGLGSGLYLGRLAGLLRCVVVPLRQGSRPPDRPDWFTAVLPLGCPSCPAVAVK